MLVLELGLVDVGDVRVCLVDVLVAKVNSRIATARPRHRNNLLKVSFRDCKVLLRDLHLLMREFGIFRGHMTLLQKMVEGCDQVFTKVKVIMVHPGGQY
jgi:hypothetical protein